MASTNFKLFDENKTNMMSDTEYNINVQRLNGVQAGIASSQLQNKTLYQTSLVAYSLAQIMMQNGYDANDSAVVSSFVGNMSNSLLQKVLDKATSVEAQNGVNNTKWMTPALTKAAIDILAAKSANVLSNETKTLYGLESSAVPDDVLSKLSKSALSYTEEKYTKTTIGTIDVGKTIIINVGGTEKEFIIVNQGKPSSLYDVSCNGTWLLMRDIYENRQWHFSNNNKYESSDINTYLNSTFFDLFDSNIKDAIKQVKIPYRKGGGSGGTDESGANGLSTKIFLLSGYEVGLTVSDDQYLPRDGAKLSYFGSGTGTLANNRRIAYLNGLAKDWWLRSPKTNATDAVWFIFSNGKFSNLYSSTSYGIRPALILPSTFEIYTDSSGNIYTEQKIVTRITDVLGNLIAIPDEQIEGGVKIATGSYTGTGTYGESNPNSLTFEFNPKLVMVNDNSQYGLIAIRGSAGALAAANTMQQYVSWGRNTVSWYCNGTRPSANNQYNANGTTYNYIALG